jgi:hypothetical protein
MNVVYIEFGMVHYNPNGVQCSNCNQHTHDQEHCYCDGGGMAGQGPRAKAVAAKSAKPLVTLILQSTISLFTTFAAFFSNFCCFVRFFKLDFPSFTGFPPVSQPRKCDTHYWDTEKFSSTSPNSKTLHIFLLLSHRPSHVCIIQRQPHHQAP